MRVFHHLLLRKPSGQMCVLRHRINLRRNWIFEWTQWVARLIFFRKTRSFLKDFGLFWDNIWRKICRGQNLVSQRSFFFNTFRLTILIFFSFFQGQITPFNQTEPLSHDKNVPTTPRLQKTFKCFWPFLWWNLTS